MTFFLLTLFFLTQVCSLIASICFGFFKKYSAFILPYEDRQYASLACVILVSILNVAVVILFLVTNHYSKFRLPVSIFSSEILFNSYRY